MVTYILKGLQLGEWRFIAIVSLKNLSICDIPTSSSMESCPQRQGGHAYADSRLNEQHYLAYA